MSSEAFEQFTENFGCWLTDHGAEGAHGGHITDGSWPATIHLPTLEAGIRDLITEARALVAAETLAQLGHAAGRAAHRGARVLMDEALDPVRAELAEIASPGGECAACGHTGQPGYGHLTAEHVQSEQDAVTSMILKDLRAVEERVRLVEEVVGLRL